MPQQGRGWARWGAGLLLAAWLAGGGVAFSANIPEFQRVVTITDTGATTVVDYDGDSAADEANDVMIVNTGANPVVCVLSSTIPAYSTTTKYPLAAGEARAVSRERFGPFVTHISCITATGTTTTVGILAYR